MTDERVAWDQQPRETGKQYHAYCHHRDLGIGRSVVKAWIEHQQRCLHVEPAPRRRCPKRWEVWCTAWSWRPRAEAYDGHMERLGRESAAKELVAIKEREARQIHAGLQVITSMNRMALEALAKPGTMARLIDDLSTVSSARLLEALDRVGRHATSLTALIECERLVHGLSTEVIEIADKREAVGSQIPANPAAVALAIQLLDTLAGTGPDTKPEEKNT